MSDEKPYSVDVIEGVIENGETFIKEVKITLPEKGEQTFTFDEAVPEDEVSDEVAVEALKELADETDFNYTEPQKFKEGSKSSEGIVKMFYNMPFTSSQFGEISNLDYATSQPAQFRNRGLITSIGKINGDHIWVLTPLGIKEAMCIIGHPKAEIELEDIRQPTGSTGLQKLFNEPNEPEEAEANE